VPSPLDEDRFEVLTFDCYGTLIDWEAGLAAAFEAAAPGRWPVGSAELLERYAAYEAEAEAGEYRTYADVLAAGARGVAGDLGVDLDEDAVAGFAQSVPEWPAFPDSREALQRLRRRYRLAAVTNCDDRLFAASSARLGDPFDWVVTAQQARAYKPSERVFEHAFTTIGVPRERILHVAQSLFHDHVPAKRLGLTTVWIDRRHDREGFGATPPAEAVPDATFPSMEAFAAAAVP
jgi:2-haloacid dehalogenase